MSKGDQRKGITKEPELEKAIMIDGAASHDARWQTAGVEYTLDYPTRTEGKEPSGQKQFEPASSGNRDSKEL